MNTKRIFFGIAMLIGMILVSGCSQIPAIGSTTKTAVPTSVATEAPVVSENNTVSAEGKIVPKDSVQLGFSASGQIEEVFFQKGDTVKNGDVIARLGGKQQLEAVIASAEYELFSANEALKTLNDNLSTDQNQALQAVNTARQAVHDAERRVTSLGGTADKNDIDIANTQVIFAKDALDKAQKSFDKYASYPENNLIRARLQVDLANKQKDYDAAIRRFNALTGSATNFDLQQAETGLTIAQTQLKLAQDKYDTLQKGPDPDLLASANERIKTAETQLAAAKTDLEKLDLVAKMDGKIVSSDLKVGNAVSAGQPLVEIADFSEWDVETDNLTEIEVVNITPGQNVIVTPDALPDLKLDGEVISISDTFEEKRGDITYTVRIKLNQADPRLRWGMTSVVDFLK